MKAILISVILFCAVFPAKTQNIKVLDLQASDLVYTSDIDRIYFIGSVESDQKDSLCIPAGTSSTKEE